MVQLFVLRLNKKLTLLSLLLFLFLFLLIYLFIFVKYLNSLFVIIFWIIMIIIHLVITIRRVNFYQTAVTYLFLHDIQKKCLKKYLKKSYYIFFRHYQESQKLQASHARHAFYFEAKASAGEPLSEEKRKVEISSLYDAMGCNKRLIELVLDLSDELHELVCMDIDIPTMPVDKVRVTGYFYVLTPEKSEHFVVLNFCTNGTIYRCKFVLYLSCWCLPTF